MHAPAIGLHHAAEQAVGVLGRSDHAELQDRRLLRPAHVAEYAQQNLADRVAALLDRRPCVVRPQASAAQAGNRQDQAGQGAPVEVEGLQGGQRRQKGFLQENVAGWHDWPV